MVSVVYSIPVDADPIDGGLPCVPSPPPPHPAHRTSFAGRKTGMAMARSAQSPRFVRSLAKSVNPRRGMILSPRPSPSSGLGVSPRTPGGEGKKRGRGNSRRRAQPQEWRPVAAEKSDIAPLYPCPTGTDPFTEWNQPWDRKCGTAFPAGTRPRSDRFDKTSRFEESLPRPNTPGSTI